MNINLLIVGGILLIISFLVGVKKQTWLLSGFNEKRVSNKNKLSFLAGGYMGIMSILFLAAGVMSFQHVKSLFTIMLLGFVVLIIYVNVKMVD
jgi:cellobiose-specific phosphotransferase system component IIC